MQGFEPTSRQGTFSHHFLEVRVATESSSCIDQCLLIGLFIEVDSTGRFSRDLLVQLLRLPSKSGTFVEGVDIGDCNISSFYYTFRIGLREGLLKISTLIPSVDAFEQPLVDLRFLFTSGKLYG